MFFKFVYAIRITHYSIRNNWVFTTAKPCEAGCFSTADFADLRGFAVLYCYQRAYAILPILTLALFFHFLPRRSLAKPGVFSNCLAVAGTATGKSPQAGLRAKYGMYALFCLFPFYF
jgi:hypothetical protein